MRPWLCAACLLYTSSFEKDLKAIELMDRIEKA